MFKTPPIVSTWKRPEDVVGRENISLLTDHFTVAVDINTTGEYPQRRIESAVGKENIPHIAEAYEKLREHGYVPLGRNTDGSLRWGVVLQSASYVEFEKGLPALQGKSLDELREIARNGWTQMMKNVDISDE